MAMAVNNSVDNACRDPRMTAELTALAARHGLTMSWLQSGVDRGGRGSFCLR